MFRMTIALAAALALPLKAQALSCLAPSTANGFLDAQSADEPYFIVVGDVTFDQTLLPDPVNGGGTEIVFVPAQLRGMGLTAGGFDQPVDREVHLKVTCWHPWCGSLLSGQSALFFVRLAEKEGEVIEVEPCPRFVFTQPSASQIEVVEACFRGETCEQGMGEY